MGTPIRHFANPPQKIQSKIPKWAEKYRAKQFPNDIYASGDMVFFKFNSINVKVSPEPNSGYLGRSSVNGQDITRSK